MVFRNYNLKSQNSMSFDKIEEYKKILIFQFFNIFFMKLLFYFIKNFFNSSDNNYCITLKNYTNVINIFVQNLFSDSEFLILFWKNWQ